MQFNIEYEALYLLCIVNEITSFPLYPWKFIIGNSRLWHEIDFSYVNTLMSNPFKSFFVSGSEDHAEIKMAPIIIISFLILTFIAAIIYILISSL